LAACVKAAGEYRKTLKLGAKLLAELREGDLLCAGPHRVLLQEVPGLVDEARHLLWRKDGAPGSKDQVEAQAQGRAEKRFFQLCLHAGLVDHDRGAGHNAVAVCVEDAARHGRRPSVVIRVDDEPSGQCARSAGMGRQPLS